jgi:general secretion pathway protein A
MYTDYWQLTRPPFDDVIDATGFHASETHQASLLKLRYLIEHRKGIGLLVGGTGMGKSCILRLLREQLPAHTGPVASIVFPQMAAHELLRYVAVELGADPASLAGSHAGVDASVRVLQQIFSGFAAENLHPVLILDEAHLIDDVPVLQALRLLLNFQPGSHAPMSLILSGHRELISSVRRIAQLDERVAVRCLLRPLTARETQSYIEQRLSSAGCQRAVFHPSAFQTVFELTAGVPRRINRLCDLALLVGYADDVPVLSSEHIEAVAEELTSASAD